MDFSKLSREDLLAELQKRDGVKSVADPTGVVITPASTSTQSSTSSTQSSKMCLYVPGKPKGAPQCTSPSETPYGYCKKHCKTVQARKAQEDYEAEHFLDEPDVGEKASIVKTLVSEEVKPVATIPQPVVVDQLEKAMKTQIQPIPKSVVTQPQQVKKEHTATPFIRRKTIRPNYWGRYEDPDTHIVFDPKTKTAYGVQEKSGRVGSLFREHIAICNKNKWKYAAAEEEESTISEEEEDSVHESDFEESESDDEDDEDDSDEEDDDDSDEEDDDDSDEDEEEDDSEDEEDDDSDEDDDSEEEDDSDEEESDED